METLLSSILSMALEAFLKDSLGFVPFKEALSCSTKTLTRWMSQMKESSLSQETTRPPLQELSVLQAMLSIVEWEIR
jgi:hypothetical protein